MRLFIAIEIPAEIIERLQPLKREMKGLKWVRNEQIHLTLAFLGEISIEKCGMLVEEIKRVEFKSFGLKIQGCGFFPNMKRASVLWMGMEPSSALSRLKGEIDNALSAVGLPLEKREFKAHATIARIRDANPADLAEIARNFESLSASFDVSSFKMFSSELKPDGAVHSVVAEFHT